MNKTSGPTPEWFGNPEQPSPRNSSGAIIVAIVATFAVTAILCGLAGVALYGVAQEKHKIAVAMCTAEQAAHERQADMMLKLAHESCRTEVARARANCSEPLVRNDNEEVNPAATPTKEAEEVIRASRAKFRTCFNETLRTSPDAQGKVNLQLIVSPTGHVRDVKLIGSTLPARMNACLEETAKALRFPPNFEEKTIQVPLTFVAK